MADIKKFAQLLDDAATKPEEIKQLSDIEK